MRFLDAPNDAVILGPVGVGKTFLATAIGHVVVRRQRSVHFERADVMLKRLQASRLDNSHDKKSGGYSESISSSSTYAESGTMPSTVSGIAGVLVVLVLTLWFSETSAAQLLVDARAQRW